jgi:uncharacterized protein (DUF305 family)
VSTLAGDPGAPAADGATSDLDNLTEARPTATEVEAGSQDPPSLEPESEQDEQDEERAWWRDPWKLLALAAAVLFLGGAIGYFVGNRRPHPGAGSVDVGFLQDMRLHHDQAVAMAMLYLDKPEDQLDPTLRQIAKEILLEQQLENGAMVQLLRDFGQAEANESGQAMGWMNHLVPADQMPGLATAQDLQNLTTATGHAADVLFTQLMIAHHEGGLHMASYAADHGQTSAVRNLAAGQLKAQNDDLLELDSILTRLGG